MMTIGQFVEHLMTYKERYEVRDHPLFASRSSFKSSYFEQWFSVETLGKAINEEKGVVIIGRVAIKPFSYWKSDNDRELDLAAAEEHLSPDSLRILGIERDQIGEIVWIGDINGHDIGFDAKNNNIYVCEGSDNYLNEFPTGWIYAMSAELFPYFLLDAYWRDTLAKNKVNELPDRRVLTKYFPLYEKSDELENITEELFCEYD